MLTSQFSCSFRRFDAWRVREVSPRWRTRMEKKNQVQRNVKNENWLQKLIYRNTDNKFNSFSLFALSHSNFTRKRVRRVHEAQELSEISYCYSLIWVINQILGIFLIIHRGESSSKIQAAAAHYWWSKQFIRGGKNQSLPCQTLFSGQEERNVRRWWINLN